MTAQGSPSYGSMIAQLRPRIAQWRLKDRPVTAEGWVVKDIPIYLTYAVKEPDDLLVGPLGGDEVEGQEPAVYRAPVIMSQL